MPGHRVANLFCMPGRCPAILMTATRWAPSSKPLILGGGNGALFRDAGCLAVPGAREIIEARPPVLPQLRKAFSNWASESQQMGTVSRDRAAKGCSDSIAVITLGVVTCRSTTRRGT